jgi:hypothetical protein
MSTMVQEYSSLSAEQIGHLARTYDDVAQPIWIHDLAAQCLYRNARAIRQSGANPHRTVFDILDGSGQIVAHLSTLAS